MSPGHEPSNATLLAKLEGLDGFMRLSVEHLSQQYENVKDIPVKVAALETDMQAVKSEQIDLKKEQSEFRAELKNERDGTKGRAVQWVSAAAISVGILVSIIFSLIQVIHP